MSTVSQKQPNVAGSFVKLIEVLQKIDTSSPDAKINEASIEDGNDGRIIL